MQQKLPLCHVQHSPNNFSQKLAPRRTPKSGLSGRSLRRTLRVQVVAGDARASSPRAPCRLARVSMKPRCRLHEPIRFINCSTPLFYSSIFIPNPGHFPVRDKRERVAQEWDDPLIKRKQSKRTRSSLLRLSVTSALARNFGGATAAAVHGLHREEIQHLAGVADPNWLAYYNRNYLAERLRVSQAIGL